MPFRFYDFIVNVNLHYIYANFNTLVWAIISPWECYFFQG
jgi:hypothetical protein